MGVLEVCKLGHLRSFRTESTQACPSKTTHGSVTHKEGGDLESPLCCLMGFSSKLKEFPGAMGRKKKKQNVGKVRGKKGGKMILAKARCSRRDAIHGGHKTASQDPIPSFATSIFHTSSHSFERFFYFEKSPLGPMSRIILVKRPPQTFHWFVNHVTRNHSRK